MNSLTIFEHDKVVSEGPGASGPAVPAQVFDWLNGICFGNGESNPQWIRPGRLNGNRAFQVTGYAGVVRAPGGFQIEVLPKIGKGSSVVEARRVLVEMIKCLSGFRHVQADAANLAVSRISLLEIFIQAFLSELSALVKRGFRSEYRGLTENLFALRGRLLVAKNITQNLCRPDRFYSEHDEFSINRAENRLLHTALRQVLAICSSQENLKAARELCFVFQDIPTSGDIAGDLRRIRLDRNMGYYDSALDWAKLILQGLSPLSLAGDRDAPSLLFPMDALFEAYVAKHLRNQLRSGFVLKAQSRAHHLVVHREKGWFHLKPDLLVQGVAGNSMVMDTKWKLLDESKTGRWEKYHLTQSDLYQLFAYGQHYLKGRGDLVLIYPRTETFLAPLPVFEFPMAPEMRLWVLPFSLSEREVLLPSGSPLKSVFKNSSGFAAVN